MKLHDRSAWVHNSLTSTFNGHELIHVANDNLTKEQEFFERCVWRELVPDEVDQPD